MAETTITELVELIKLAKEQLVNAVLKEDSTNELNRLKAEKERANKAYNEYVIDMCLSCDEFQAINDKAIFAAVDKADIAHGENGAFRDWYDMNSGNYGCIIADTGNRLNAHVTEMYKNYVRSKKAFRASKAEKQRERRAKLARIAELIDVQNSDGVISSMLAKLEAENMEASK